MHLSTPRPQHRSNLVLGQSLRQRGCNLEGHVYLLEAEAEGGPSGRQALPSGATGVTAGPANGAWLLASPAGGPLPEDRAACDVRTPEGSSRVQNIARSPLRLHHHQEGQGNLPVIPTCSRPAGPPLQPCAWSLNVARLPQVHVCSRRALRSRAHAVPPFTRPLCADPPSSSVGKPPSRTPPQAAQHCLHPAPQAECHWPQCFLTVPPPSVTPRGSPRPPGATLSKLPTEAPRPMMRGVGTCSLQDGDPSGTSRPLGLCSSVCPAP